MTFDELFNYYADYGFTKPTSLGGLGSLVEPTSIPPVSGVANIETLIPTTTVENKTLESNQPLNVLQFQGGGDEAFSGNIDTTNNAGITSLGDIPGVVSNVFDAAVSRINPGSILGLFNPALGILGNIAYDRAEAARVQEVARQSAIAQEAANRDAAREAAAAKAAAKAKAAANRDRAKTGGGNNTGSGGGGFSGHGGYGSSSERGAALHG
jgi:hypothetical protein